MKKCFLFCAFLVQVCVLDASWFWPFGDDEPEKTRLSVLMRPATRLIDEATEMAATNNLRGARAKYQQALLKLAEIENENPERAKTVEFTSLRNKRAYVSAAVDSLYLSEARENARSVSLTDTDILERKFERELQYKEDVRSASNVSNLNSVIEAYNDDIERLDAQFRSPLDDDYRERPKSEKSVVTSVDKLVAALKKQPNNRKLRLALIGEYIGAERYDEAQQEIGALLKKKSTDSSALNLRAVCEVSQGRVKEAEETLLLSIKHNPQDFNGYYNLANLKLHHLNDREAAQLYYLMGRKVGRGPRDEKFEEALK